MLIYLGVFFILPDNIKKKILSNSVLCATIIAGFLGGLYGISLYSVSEGFYQSSGSGGCASNRMACSFLDQATPYCLINEKPLPTLDLDQTVIFNIYGRYVRVYASATEGDGIFSLSQVVVTNAAGTNIALGKTTRATSTNPSSKVTSTAIDGNLTLRPRSAIWYNNNVGRETEYWQVDLGSLQMITTVRIISAAPTGSVSSGSSGSIKNNGLRVVVIKDPTEVRSPNGICVAEPTPIYPPGTTAEEQAVIGPIILDGLNGQTALNVYRGVASLPSSFVTYGFTDSESAAAVLKIMSTNRMRERKAGTITDAAYFSSIQTYKSITTMAEIANKLINVSSELQIFMNANKKEKKVATDGSGSGSGFGSGSGSGSGTLDSAGNVIATITTTSDGGKEAATKTIMAALKPMIVDPSAGYSQATNQDDNNAIPAPPNTGTWAQTALLNMPQTTAPITTPTNGPSTTTPGLTRAQREAAVRANNPNVLIITPDMTMEQASAAVLAANATQNVAVGTSPLSRSAMDEISATTSSGRGFSSPTLSQAAGGQEQWYMRTTPVSNAEAAAQCTAYNGRLATLAQITDAQANAASYSGTAGWYADTPNGVAYPSSTRVEQSVPAPGTYAVNCYGPKPPPGTADVAPWTNRAYTVPIGANDTGGQTYTRGDWSRRGRGDGGIAKSTDGTTIKFPGTPYRTQEVYYVGATQSISKTQARTLCGNLGGKLATTGQLTAATTAGAKWCKIGWLDDTNTASVLPSGCESTTVTGAVCFGIKPSKDNGPTEYRATIPPSKSNIDFNLNLHVEPFNKTMNAGITTTMSWTQVAQDAALYCRSGTVNRNCMINGVLTDTCVKSDNPVCDDSCNTPTTQASDTDPKIGGKKICSALLPPPTPTCPPGASLQLCSGKERCVPEDGDCAGAFSPIFQQISPAPSDLSDIRYMGYCNNIMMKMNHFSRSLQAPLTLNRASWPPQSATVVAIPAIEYVPDNIYNTLTPKPETDTVYCGNNPDSCRRACCWGGTPVLKNIWITGKHGEYPGNMGLKITGSMGRRWGDLPGWTPDVITRASAWEWGAPMPPLTDKSVREIGFVTWKQDAYQRWELRADSAQPKLWKLYELAFSLMPSSDYLNFSSFQHYETMNAWDSIYVCPAPVGTPCTQNDHCLSNRCNTSDGTYVCGCNNDADCIESKKCNTTTNKCKLETNETCISNGDCVSGICKDFGNNLKKCGCSQNTDCPSRDCVNNVCRNRGGATCDLNINGLDCKSERCNGDKKCASLTGEACSSDGDCKNIGTRETGLAPGICQNSECLALVGEQCVVNQNCLSNICDNELCISAIEAAARAAARAAALQQQQQEAEQRRQEEAEKIDAEWRLQNGLPSRQEEAAAAAAEAAAAAAAAAAAEQRRWEGVFAAAAAQAAAEWERSQAANAAAREAIYAQWDVQLRQGKNDVPAGDRCLTNENCFGRKCVDNICRALTGTSCFKDSMCLSSKCNVTTRRVVSIYGIENKLEGRCT